MKMSIGSWVAASLWVLAACAQPRVAYKPISAPDSEGWTKFRFAESIIRFDFGKTPAGMQNTAIIEVSSVPVPHGYNKFGMAGTSHFGVSTTVNATYRGDSDLIQQVTIAVVDTRQQMLQSLGSAVAAIGGLLSIAPEEVPVVLPTGISVTNLLNSLPAGCVNPMAAQTPGKSSTGPDANKSITCTDLALDGTKDFTADVSISEVPVDALPSSVMDKAFESANFFYSACRSLTITLKPRPELKRRPIAATLAVADPRFLQTLRFPEKGTITVAPSCGANSLAQSSGLPTAIDYLNTLATQAKAVKEGLKGKSGASQAK